MAVISRKPYVGEPRDTVAKFNGKQIVYTYWEQHLLFATPYLTVVEPSMRFADYWENVIKPLMQPDPDSAKVDLAQVKWTMGKKEFVPDVNATLAENGIVHKAQLCFRTPGLNSLLAA
jgi:phenol hydroxylase P4 protein